MLPYDAELTFGSPTTFSSADVVGDVYVSLRGESEGLVMGLYLSRDATLPSIIGRE